MPFTPQDLPGYAGRLFEPPLRLLLGAGAVESAEHSSQARAVEAQKWAAVSRSADFAAAGAPDVVAIAGRA